MPTKRSVLGGPTCSGVGRERPRPSTAGQGVPEFTLFSAGDVPANVSITLAKMKSAAGNNIDVRIRPHKWRSWTNSSITNGGAKRKDAGERLSFCRFRYVHRRI